MTDQPGKRILWHSGAPWVSSGYGVQTALFAPRIRDAGYDMAISAWFGLGGSALDWNDITVLPADDNWGNTLLPHYAEKVKADLVLTLMDVWVLKPELFARMPTACWVPVDHEPCPPKVAEFFKLSGARPIAMSRFGERELERKGLDPLYVPHAVDTNVYKPFEDDRAELRKSLGLPVDAFIAGMVANNSGHTPPRKAFPQAITAFAELQRRHPDAMLYLHSEISGTRSRGNSGVSLPTLCELHAIPPSAVGFAPQVDMEIGIPAEAMAGLYSAFDVLLSPSYGEGFGIPIIEAQACGTPVIVTDWTAMPELCGSGWKVEGKPYYDPQHGAYFMDPEVGMIIDALEEAYEWKGTEKAEAASRRARLFALQYDADKVMDEHWKPVLAELFRPREVPPLNRAMRRQAARLKAA